MRTPTTLIVILALGLAATSASAARRPVVTAVAAKAAPRFAALDTNSNRSLDATEWAASGAPANSFDLVDSNANGSIGFFEVVRMTVARVVAKRR